MGNGSSQSVVLASPQRALVFNTKAYSHYQRRGNRYATPENKVLPRPVAGQRLRPTENGNILHSAGTIRGQRAQDVAVRSYDDEDTEFGGPLRRKCPRDDDAGRYGHLANGFQVPLRDQRMFLSEPDITRSALYQTDGGQKAAGIRRSVAADSPSKSKIKSKKKARAPEPPSSTLSTGAENGGRHNPPTERTITTGAAKVGGVSKPPQGPPRGDKGKAPPPPPPPLPNFSKGKEQPLLGKGSVARSQGFEKNIRAVDKWKLSRSAQDITCSSKDPPVSRTTVFDSRTNLPKEPSKKPALAVGLPPSRHPDAFQKEISAITKKIAEGHRKVIEELKAPTKWSENRVEGGKKPYYFSDDAGGLAPAMKKWGEGDKKKKQSMAKPTKHGEAKTTSSSSTTTDPSDTSGEACIEEFGRQRHLLQRGTKIEKKEIKAADKKTRHQARGPPPPPSIPPPKRSAEQGGSTNSSEFDPDIDIHLRPMLPRRSIDAPRIISPNEIWQSISVVSESPRLPSSSEDGDAKETPVRRFTRPVAPKKAVVTERRGNNATSAAPGAAEEPRSVCKSMKNGSDKGMRVDDSLWTPRHDLQDDSDASSIEGEVVLPRNNNNRVDNIPVNFAFPTSIFTNSKQTTNTEVQKTVNNNDPAYAESRPKGRLKKLPKRGDVVPVPKEYFNTLTNLKKLLRMRSRYFLDEDDVPGLDSNWSLGNHDHFRGQQKKSSKYGLVVPSRNGGYMEDITVSSAEKIKEEKDLPSTTSSSFSFYSTEGHVIYLPKKDSNNSTTSGERGGDPHCGKGKKLYLNRKNECNAAQMFAIDSEPPPSRKILPDDLNEQKKEVIRFIEEEVRKRCLIEKMHLRQQLHLLSSKEDEDISDEIVSDLSGKDGPSPYEEDVNQSMSHWKSSPALLEGTVNNPNEGGHSLREDTWSSSSSITSLDLLDPETWKDPRTVDDWLQRQTNKNKENSFSPTRPEPEGGRSSSEEYRMASESRRLNGFRSEVEDRERKGIYRRLMETVQQEDQERGRRKRNDPVGIRHRANSASYSSPWSGSEESSSPNSVGERVSKGWHASPGRIFCNGHAELSSTKRGSVPNSELSSGFSERLQVSPTMEDGDVRKDNEPIKPTFQVTFVQPFNPSKGYRPVPFRVTALPTGVNGC